MNTLPARFLRELFFCLANMKGVMVMCADSLENKLCTSCGSTRILENYPASGLSICVNCGKEVTCVSLKVILEDKALKLLG